MTLSTYPDIAQGTPEWDDVRRGLVTASAVGALLTAGGKVANNDTSRTLTNLLVAERITGHTDPTYQSDDMLRGLMDESLATAKYAEHFDTPVAGMGFMSREIDGWHLGYSPDGLVGDVGLVEVKSRRQKKHLQTILADQVPPENVAQIQCALLVSGRAWCDYISWCGGMPMWTKRVYPDPVLHVAIVEAVAQFEETAAQMLADYAARTKGLPMTERATSYDPEVVI
jgi:hypothetical protein